jgi:hypothetical protein
LWLIELSLEISELKEGSGKEALQLSPINSEVAVDNASKGDIWFFYQKNIKASRKALQPLVHELLAKL